MRISFQPVRWQKLHFVLPNKVPPPRWVEIRLNYTSMLTGGFAGTRRCRISYNSLIYLKREAEMLRISLTHTVLTSKVNHRPQFCPESPLKQHEDVSAGSPACPAKAHRARPDCRAYEITYCSVRKAHLLPP